MFVHLYINIGIDIRLDIRHIHRHIHMHLHTHGHREDNTACKLIDTYIDTAMVTSAVANPLAEVLYACFFWGQPQWLHGLQNNTGGQLLCQSLPFFMLLVGCSMLEGAGPRPVLDRVIYYTQLSYIEYRINKPRVQPRPHIP